MDDFSRYIHFCLQRSRAARNRATSALPPNAWAYPNQPWRSRTAGGTDAAEYDAFCNCWKDRFNVNECTCGEVGKAIEWVWDVDTKSNCTHLMNNNKDIRFHLHYSGGTAVIKGNRAITANQHYWEVKLTSPVYGTDMMVGIGTKDADVHKLSDKFCSVLGIDAETWGLSYTGLFHHEGSSRQFSSGFGQGTIIGVHLDMWNGTMSFYKNRQPLGVACGGLKGKTLYPMVSSTAARSGMRIIHSISFPSSLQFLACVALRKSIPAEKSVFDVVPLPPGMQMFLSNNLGWLLGECHLEGLQEELNKNNERIANELADSQTCAHQHLTCDDCHTPVIAGNGKEALLEIMPRTRLRVGPVLLHRNRQRTLPSASSIPIIAIERRRQRGGSEKKKRRFTAQHSGDDDSD